MQTATAHSRSQGESANTLAPGEAASENVFDTRGMEPPSNVLAILKKVTEGTAGDGMTVLLDSNPFQLYDLLQQRGFLLKVERRSDGSFRGKISRRKDLGH